MRLTGDGPLVKCCEENLESYDLCLEALRHLGFTQESHDKCRQYCRQAVALDPSCALEYDPLSPPFNAHLGILYSNARQHDRAIAQQRLAIELNPNFPVAYRCLGIACLYGGLLNQAISTVEKGIELFGRYWFLLTCLASCHASAGRTAEARQLLEELTTRSRATYIPPTAIGLIHHVLGELEQALE